MKQPCWKCNGTGKDFDPNITAIQTCSVCGGTGYLDDMVHVVQMPEVIYDCPYCNQQYKNNGGHNCINGLFRRVEELESKLEAIAGLVGEKDEHIPTCSTISKTETVQPLGDDLSVND